MDEDWISITEAAARLTQSGDKVDRSTLSRYLKQHAEALPLREDGRSNKVDYIALVEHRSGNIRIRSAPAGTLFSSVASPAPSSGGVHNRNKTQADGNARKALADAELKEMDLAKRRGELTIVDEVDQAGRDAVALMQSAFERAIEPEGRLGQVSEPYWRKDADKKSWFGRGQIQLTHKVNYDALGKRIDVDLVGNPSLALDLDVSAHIAIVGMLEGLFTGKKLIAYFNLKKDDPVGARAVVNGRDKAKLIAGYYKSFLDALEAAALAYYKGQPDDVAERDAQPDNVPAMKSKSLLTIIGSFVGAIGLGAVDDLKGVVETGATLFGAISNPWAFGSLVFATTGAVVLTWLVGTGRITINRSAAP
ncbi:glycoside hydrolase family 19 protein [Agrobacterium pusense]|uniref:glycoside hydrolase family 19 protein n=1 Tax=Agrobacterium pusense TaxID=648995 RepID=UPI0024158FEE|nr:glycoside hydrolase family 19 protein [Agrobacterium pusense]WFN88008.1 glycoside hydrolase family 19 protein [Agrobacterium pusense]